MQDERCQDGDRRAAAVRLGARDPQSSIQFFAVRFNPRKETCMSRKRVKCGLVAASAALFVLGAALPAQAQERRSPTSSSSWATTSAGSTSAPTTGASCPARRRTSTSWPSEGMLFTDYYAEASCTAGRANFITGEIPLRTGLTTVGQAGADVGMPAQAVHASPPRSRRRATPPASSARTTSAI